MPTDGLKEFLAALDRLVAGSFDYGNALWLVDMAYGQKNGFVDAEQAMAFWEYRKQSKPTARH